MTTYTSTFIRKTDANVLILWIPGANDTFYHQEQLDNGLFKDCDIYLLHPNDYHPCNPCAETNPPGHTAEHFFQYFEGIDDEISKHCLSYKRIVAYAHSTGALLLIEYLLHGKYRNYITKAIFDDPFLSFNTPNIFIRWIQQQIFFFPSTWKIHILGITFNKYSLLRKNVVSKTKLHQRQCQYNMPFVYENNDYAGYIVACTRTQKKIMDAVHPLLSIPCLILIAEGDRMLREKDSREISKKISIQQEVNVISGCYHSVLFPDDKLQMPSIFSKIHRFIYSNTISISNYKLPKIELYHNRLLFIPTFCIYLFVFCIININHRVYQFLFW